VKEFSGGPWPGPSNVRESASSHGAGLKEAPPNPEFPGFSKSFGDSPDLGSGGAGGNVDEDVDQTVSVGAPPRADGSGCEGREEAKVPEEVPACVENDARMAGLSGPFRQPVRPCHPSSAGRGTLAADGELSRNTSGLLWPTSTKEGCEALEKAPEPPTQLPLEYGERGGPAIAASEVEAVNLDVGGTGIVETVAAPPSSASNSL